MIYIAHRGLIAGPDKDKENNPEWIQEVLNKGFSAEIDLWRYNDELILGHDEPQYRVSIDFLLANRQKLWIHAKDIDALEYLSTGQGLNYFWHDKDDYTITSYGYIWAYPGKKVPSMGICVQPEWDSNFDPTNFKPKCIGICSKHVGLLAEYN